MHINATVVRWPAWGCAFSPHEDRHVRAHPHAAVTCARDAPRSLDGYPWVTSHTLRKTVASRLHEEGFSIRHIADQLGHARPSTTLDNYLGRRAVTTADFADALTALTGDPVRE